MKTLYIIRHAKSSWSSNAENDFDRPLNQRGKRDAPLMGEVLYVKQVFPDLFLSSSAKRAKKTAKKIARKIGYDKKNILYKESLYLAAPEEIIAEIKSVDNSIHSLAVVGHNPGMTEIINLLSNVHIDNLPTCGIAALSIEIDQWADLTIQSKAKMLFFDYPKKYLNL